MLERIQLKLCCLSKDTNFNTFCQLLKIKSVLLVFIERMEKNPLQDGALTKGLRMSSIRRTH